MRHTSMLPPQSEPAYRQRMRDRETRWHDLAVMRVRQAELTIRMNAMIKRSDDLRKPPLVRITAE